MVANCVYRFMKVDEGQEYSLPDLSNLEHSLEIAISKVRVEMERKIGGQMNKLESMVILTCFDLFDPSFFCFCCCCCQEPLC